MKIMLEKSALKVLSLFFYIFVIYFVGCLIFTKGFLLKRNVISENSTCKVDFARYMDGADHGAEGCWVHRRFDKAIIIVIDALRFDFIAPLKSTDKIYANNLKHVHKLLREKPQHAQLFRFTADPPTTTLQRLKGLTTGSLPTFVDAGSNFASTEISEDNVIDQVYKSGKRLTFLGDDTWTNLFPRQFHRSFPFPSFNVKDLHTVDNGILSKIYQEIERSDWDVLIAHFLGVDHCGHRFGPYHQAMQEKLLQMNELIRNVTELLDEDTVLFVFGDHGMTSTGDHGGDSFEEVDAGLFVYSKSQLSTDLKPKETYRAVSQIDLVPTISLLLGLPVPFSNLGTVITELFAYCSWSKDSHIKEVYHKVEALRLNARQVSGYITHYAQSSSDLPHQKVMLLQSRLNNAEKTLQTLVTNMFVHNDVTGVHETLHSLEKEYASYMEDVKQLCKDVWARFDMISIVLGFLLFAISLLVNGYIFQVIDSLSESKWAGSVMIVLGVSCVFLVISVLYAFYIETKSFSIMTLILGAVDVVALLIILHVTMSNKDESPQASANSQSAKSHLSKLVPYILLLVTFLCYFSNSFVVFEDSVTLFLAQTAIICFSVKAIYKTFKENKNVRDLVKSKTKGAKSPEIKKLQTQSVLPIVFLATTCCMCLRLSANFRSQREEQLSEDPSANEEGSLQSNALAGNKNVKFFLEAGCILLIVYLPRKFLTESGNLNGVTGSVLCARYLMPVGAVITVLYWALQCLPQKVLDSLPVWQQVFLPQAVYMIAVLSLGCLFIWPLLIYLLPKQGKPLPVDSSGDFTSLTNKLFNYIKNDMNADNSTGTGEQSIPQVFGLATVFTSALVYQGIVVLLLLSLLLGAGVSPSVLLAVGTIFSFLELTSIAIRACRDSDMLVDVIVAWSLIAWSYFYGFGHQATIPAIRFEAAFVGFYGDWENKVLPAVMIHSNMFASEILFSFLSPLLILWPCTKGVIAGYILPKRDGSENSAQGDFVMYNNSAVFRQLLIRLVATLFLIHGFKLGASMLAATLLRRHLMVWKIFAPRFVYQALSTFTVMVVSILTLVTTFRVETALHKWTQKLK